MDIECAFYCLGREVSTLFVSCILVFSYLVFPCTVSFPPCISSLGSDTQRPHPVPTVFLPSHETTPPLYHQRQYSPASVLTNLHLLTSLRRLTAPSRSPTSRPLPPATPASRRLLRHLSLGLYIPRSPYLVGDVFLDTWLSPDGVAFNGTLTTPIV